MSLSTQVGAWFKAILIHFLHFLLENAQYRVCYIALYHRRQETCQLANSFLMAPPVDVMTATFCKDYWFFQSSHEFIYIYIIASNCNRCSGGVATSVSEREIVEPSPNLGRFHWTYIRTLIFGKGIILSLLCKKDVQN